MEIAGRRVDYVLTRPKSAKKLRMRIGPNLVTVALPADRDTSEVEPFLHDNTAWITAQLARTDTLRELHRPRLVPQGEILYRGKPLKVVVEERSAMRGAARVILEETRIVIVRSANSRTPPRRTLENWLRKEARSAIETELERVTQKLNCHPNRVYLMDQRTKWGNCSAKGNLSFSWRLMMAPPSVLRYLVTHEAVHLVVPDHSRKFWLTVQSLCPETERARQWLCANAERLRPDLSALFAQSSD